MTDTSPEEPGTAAPGGSDAVQLDAQLELEFAATESLELNEEWVAWLVESAEIPATVAGVDPSISYDDDGSAVA
jgi:hypothetical protein